MKHAVFSLMTPVFMLAAAGLIVGPATSPASATPETVAYTQEATSQSPQGVSPADPSIKPPNTGEWVCSRCGAAGAGPGAGYHRHKGRNGGPMLAPGHKDARGAWGARGQRGHGHGMKGHSRGVAADRMLRHSADLKLTNDQIGKLEMLSYETKKRMIDLHADIELEQLEVKKQMQSGSDDLTQIKRHLSAISNAKLGIQEARIENLFEARKILTREQKEMVKANHPRLGRILD